MCQTHSQTIALRESPHCILNELWWSIVVVVHLLVVFQVVVVVVAGAGLL